MSFFILFRNSTIGKYFGFLFGLIGKFLRGILASLGVLLPFLLLHQVHAVTIFVQEVGELFESLHLDFGIT
jgi:hypothetical protein